MDTKLTLKLNENIIKNAKKFAKKNRQSLSKLVENYFKSLTQRSNLKSAEVPPIVKSLAGVLKTKKDLDHKGEYTDYLIQKYK